ncbi:hypothetical protein J7K28_02745 [Candidatus Aerophobetes bacterium]|nr:hypothetical protein [Candidatus Aerophobetes bacterium]
MNIEQELKLYSPVEGMSVSNFAVHFLWHKVESWPNYELQYSQERDFSKATSLQIVDTMDIEDLAYLPQGNFSEGKWFWRVRAIEEKGSGGKWSKISSFIVRDEASEKTRELKISPEHPLFVLFSTGKISLDWGSLPQILKPYTVLRVEMSPLEKLIDICYVAQREGIPILIQASGPKDTTKWHQGRYNRVPLSFVEYIFQKFPIVKGAMIVEQSCQGGARNPLVVQYLSKLIKLVAEYGKVVIWADGRWGNDVWAEASSNKILYELIKKHKEYLIPLWKMNCGLKPYLIQGNVFGLFLSNTVSNWGVEPESFFWYEAGFRDLNEQRGFKEGVTNKCPSPFYGQMILLGLSAGATVYSLEPPIWEKPGKFNETWQKICQSLLSKIVEWKVIPVKSLVKKKVKVALLLSEKLPRPDGQLHEVAYEFQHPSPMIPTQGKYFWIPVLPRYTSSEILGSFPGLVRIEKFSTFNEARQFLNQYYQNESESSAWVVKVGKYFFITNSYENQDVAQTFKITLNGKFKAIEGKIEVNSYLIVKQDKEEIKIHSAGRNERKLNLHVFTEDEPGVTINPPSSLVRKEFKRKNKYLELAINYFKGAVDIILR